MALTNRVVDIIVPNRTAKRTRATISIEAIDPKKLPGVEFEGEPLEVGRFGLTPETCGDVKRLKLSQRLTLNLDPFSESTVRAIIQTSSVARKKAIAAFAVKDVRGRAVVGGVTVVCTSPDYPTLLPAAPDPANPCPLTLASTLTAVDPGASPATRAKAGGVGTAHVQELVAVLVNSGTKTLTGAEVWLEHMDGSGIVAESKVWHIGTIEPGGKFWATWEIDPRGATEGEWEAVLVARSSGDDPVRLRGGLRVLPRNW